MKTRLTIARKLLGLTVFAVVCLAAQGSAGLAARHYLTDGADRVLEAQEALRVHMQASQAQDASRGDVLAMLSAREIDAEAVKAMQARLQSHAREAEGWVKKLDGMELDDASRAALKELKPSLEAYGREAEALVGLALSDRIAVQMAQGEFNASFARVRADMAKISELIAQNARAAEQRSRVTSARTAQVVGIFTAVCCVLLLLAGWAISRDVVRRLARAVDVAQTVARGDLTSRIEVRGSDEAAQLLAALARMNDNLLQLVGTVRQSSDSIATGSVQIATGNQDLSQRTEEQASNLQQTAASMEQISATVRGNAQMTQEASGMAATVSRSAQESGDAVARLVATMAEITEASRRMSDIIGAIDGIAFQTNILALNAAVEAARAGEQGRGFAVVAGEVRALAQRSAGAAREIRDLIGASVERISLGEKHAAEAGERMGDVVAKVGSMTRLLGDISTSTAQQTKGIDDVSRAVTHIDQVTQTNASLVEEAAAAAESLNQQAARLVDAVALFRVEGYAAAPAA